MSSSKALDSALLNTHKGITEHQVDVPPGDVDDYDNVVAEFHSCVGELCGEAGLPKSTAEKMSGYLKNNRLTDKWRST
jgi:hypothetical protein